jgi:hypothetical protein
MRREFCPCAYTVDNIEPTFNRSLKNFFKILNGKKANCSVKKRTARERTAPGAIPIPSQLPGIKVKTNEKKH